MNSELLTQLSQAKPTVRGTSLITYLISANSDLWLVQKHLRQELSTAENIKNKSLRKAVVNNITSILQNIPKGNSGEHGFVILSGDVESYF